MKVYHGSNVIVEKPEVKQGRANADFGLGFYVTGKNYRKDNQLWKMKKNYIFIWMTLFNLLMRKN